MEHGFLAKNLSRSKNETGFADLQICRFVEKKTEKSRKRNKHAITESTDYA
jgi:hypothetical protein